MFGGVGKAGEEALDSFQRIVSEFLNIKLKVENIYPIYDYFHEKLDKINYVFYAEVDEAKEFKEEDLQWVTFVETLKMLFSAHTKQDVVVGERVINLKWRISRNLQAP